MKFPLNKKSGPSLGRFKKRESEIARQLGLFYLGQQSKVSNVGEYCNEAIQ
jgi:hypothetical protein